MLARVAKCYPPALTDLLAQPICHKFTDEMTKQTLLSEKPSCLSYPVENNFRVSKLVLRMFSLVWLVEAGWRNLWLSCWWVSRFSCRQNQKVQPTALYTMYTHHLWLKPIHIWFTPHLLVFVLTSLAFSVQALFIVRNFLLSFIFLRLMSGQIWPGKKKPRWEVFLPNSKWEQIAGRN